VKPVAVLAMTRVARRVFNSANVPRLGVPPSLLLYFAALNTLCTMLGGVATETSIGSGHRGMNAIHLRWSFI